MRIINNNSIVFIAFEQRENLGIGYMHAVLSEAGYNVYIIDLRKERAEILRTVKDVNPFMVGFSVIFENHIHDFRELIEYLRENGIQCHFTAGGHFASLKPDELFEIAPALDSLVRFEGEHGVLQLANRLRDGRDWHTMAGISYMNKKELVNNTLRPLEPDLDVFPIPYRPDLKEYALNEKYATMLAGRGCIHHCSFCDIREFYGTPPGPVKRVRSPGLVVEEMEYLHSTHECSVFLFQDDDFPVKTNRTTTWIQEFCTALRKRHLNGKILWKVNCRPDEVDQEEFQLMKEHGLFKVYLGIEEGTDEGLMQMNKRLKVSDHLEAVQILKELGISIDYGFMLFQPSSTFSTVRENLAFLDQICGDGYMPVFFLKMMPYLATSIEKELRKEGRIKGQPGFFDYDFSDKAVDDYYVFTSEVLNNWFHAPDGLNNYFKWVVNYLYVFNFFHGSNPETDRITDQLIKEVAGANHFITDTMNRLSALFESGDYSMEGDPALEKYKSAIEQRHSDSLQIASGLLDKIKVHYLRKSLHV